MTTTFFLAWTDEGVPFSAGTHATVAQKVWDGAEGGEVVFSLTISHEEGGFPSLTAEMINPRIGLLSAGRNLWVWLSEDSGAGAVARFNGRVVGVPQRLTDEIIEVEFVSRPPNYISQRASLADSLRVLPWFDPVWLQDNLDDPDTVLETRTARWHIDRLTLTVTASDIIAGEAGTIEIGEADHFYDGVEVSYADAPLRRIAVSGTVSWTQAGSGDIDLTRELVDAFRAAGSPYEYPVISSLTGDGMLSDWPEPQTDIGGGWLVGADAMIENATWLLDGGYVVRYIDKTDDAPTLYQNPTTGKVNYLFTGWVTWEVAFPLTAYKVHFTVHYDAERARSETATASLEADVQPLIVDPGAAEEDKIELASTFVGEPIDAGNAMPIGDVRRNSYFKTDRGAQSWEYLLLLARARLIARARAVQIKFVTPWATAAAISCRHNGRLLDYRLPGGEAIGKVVAYTLSASGDGDIGAEVTIACTIGYGVALGAALAGTPVYVEDGYVNDGYQARTGGQSTLIAGELLYEDFDNFAVTDDDGVNLFDMTARTVLNSLTVANGPNAQRTAIDAFRASAMPDPIVALREAPTVVTLDLVPVTGGAFHVDYDIDVSALVIAQTIDLGAAA